MKKKRLLSLVTVLALVIGIFSMMPSAGAVSEKPVNLIYAKPVSVESGIGALGYVEVENIAYNKNVTVHYSFDGKEWYDCIAEYYKPTWGNYEAWRFETLGRVPSYRGTVNIQFAIKYEVDGQIYWDNNDGQNYSVSSGYYDGTNFAIGVGGIANSSAYIYNDAIHGTAQLKNLGLEKIVKVIYTTDDWKTSSEVDAEYVSTSKVNDSIEIWGYTIPTTDSNIKYKLSYTVNGTTYIDDNFGDYYTI